MRWLISLCEGAIEYFTLLYGDEANIFVASDPEGKNVGSGGAVCHLLNLYGSEGDDHEPTIIINAGGESRRLPAYSAYGKSLLPIPVMKWSRGQKIDQRLLDLQKLYLERIAWNAPSSLKTIVASGDIYIDLPTQLPKVPEADVVCLGLWSTPEVATKHGVFVTSRQEPSKLLKMLQKPPLEVLAEEGEHNLLLIDSGVWLLSERAIEILQEEVTNAPDGYYDIYTDFGAILGAEASSELTTAVWVVDDAQFYHFGSTPELLSSTYRLQNKVLNQKEWLNKRWKKHGTIFAQNAIVRRSFAEENQNIWIENSYVPETWCLQSNHVITGIPENNWELSLPEGICIDLVPLREPEGCYALRLYHFNDTFKGGKFLGQEIGSKGATDLYDLPLFPIITDLSDVPSAVESMLSGEEKRDGVGYLSGRQLLTQLSLILSEAQRNGFLQSNMRAMRQNPNSVFYTTDLQNTAEIWLLPPEAPTEEMPLQTLIHELMFTSEWKRIHQEERAPAYDDAKEALAQLTYQAQDVELLERPTQLYEDQIVWARSPVRIDVAGGWTDTPPYCYYEGGGVVNFSLLLNGQEPLQTYIKRSPHKVITLRSIDLGQTEEVTTTKDLYNFSKPGSPFAIPKAALVLAGVSEVEESWETIIERMGGGVEITLLSALPAGSGLGTSSILGATVLGALSEYFGLNWDEQVIGTKTLLLEQLLTTGGGWQDQYGGLYGGLKYITTDAGLAQTPRVQWLSTGLLVRQEYSNCHLLFYTGQTRMAKNVLSNIVDKVLLNKGDTLAQLREIRHIAHEMAVSISHTNFTEYGQLLKNSWYANKRLDPGTSTPEIEQIIKLIDDYSLGYKLPGAGGGGFLYMVAKDEEAATRIRKKLKEHEAELPPTARFVDMSLSPNGLQVSKS